ncbi:MAG: rhomboid family intramembrane serine protease, partial [candidate division KSB1 bacterium]|nr:rhomboid family intramembrane serine protease [candidate division KSB1 bacterium]
MDSYSGTTFGLGARLTPAVRALLIVNGVVYVLQHVVGRSFVLTFGLVPALAVERLLLWQIVTYMFLHGGIFHLLFNLFALWMFGSEVEAELGTRRFFRFYLLSGVGGALLYLLFRAHSYVPVIGASAAIYGVLVGFAVLFPQRMVTLLLFLVLPVNLRAWQLAGLFVGISLLFGVTGTSDGVAHLAHLGGALVGYLFLAGGRLW